jgi:hypothetical protein
MAGFVDRLDPATYEDDEVVGVSCPEAGTEAWVPEALFHRMQSIASGYRLHVLPLLGEDALWSLSVPQAESLADELAFLAEVTNDPALLAQLSAISRVASSGIGAAAKAAVVFGWP